MRPGGRPTPFCYPTLPRLRTIPANMGPPHLALILLSLGLHATPEVAPALDPDAGAPAARPDDMATELTPLLDLTGTDAVAVGGMFGLNGHPDQSVNSLGAGIELSYTHYVGDYGSSDKRLLGYGAFLHGQALGLGTSDLHGYAALGGQLNYMVFGAELGGATEFLDQSHSNTFFVHLAPYVSLGVVWIGFHVDVPMFSVGAGPAYGPGYGVEIGLQLPLFIGDRPKFEGLRLPGPFGGG